MQATTLSPIATRFVWKEYRTLRGMWLAVAALGMFTQCLSVVFAVPGSNMPSIMFGTALGAAVLYAIGATSVLFSVEHEDETYHFLSGLPTRWLPMLAGKLTVATLSAFALAAVLALAGWGFAGLAARGAVPWPSRTDAANLLAVFGLGIVEALVWGTLFSLLIKRPLIAAILTIVVGTIAVQVLVSTNATGNLAAADPDAYVAALPARLVVVAVLLILCFALARRWLAVGVRPVRIAGVAANSELEFSITQVMTFVEGGESPAPRRRMLGRLVWQTWRQSWRTLLLPAAVALFLTAGVGAVNSATLQHADLLVAATTFFLLAIYGAMVFGADQRRRQYRFLAEHAARPRSVWLVRHIVWGGALVTIFIPLALLIALGSGAVDNLQRIATQISQPYSFPEELMQPAGMSIWRMYFRGLTTFSTTALLAYATGQVFSMLLRSEIMAAFAACLAAVSLCAWCSLTFLWGLSPLWFMLPLVAGCFAATWLRAPDWLTERNAWRGWWRPAAAIFLPALAVAAAIPLTRLHQLDSTKLARAEQTIARVRARFNAGNTPAARETAEMYFKAADRFDAWRDKNPLERWGLSEPLPAMVRSGQGGMIGDSFHLGQMVEISPGKSVPTVLVDPDRIPAKEFDAYESAVKEFWKLFDAAKESALKEFTTASTRPHCRFEFDLSFAPLKITRPSFRAKVSSRDRLDRQYLRLVKLTHLASANYAGHQALDQFLTVLRATAHLRDGQPSLLFVDQLSMESAVLDRVVQWARLEATTDEEIRSAIHELQKFFASLPDPAEAIWADQQLVLKVLDYQSPPLLFAHPPIAFDVQLAYVLNRAPWESLRAHSKLALLTAIDIRRVDDLLTLMRNNKITHSWPLNVWPTSHEDLRRVLDATMQGNFALSRASGLAGGADLVDFEYAARSHARQLELSLTNTETRRRATLLQLALELYRRVEGHYPVDLQKLAPNYLKRVPIDPFSGTPFNYLPEGVDLLVAVTPGFAGEIPPGTPLLWSVGPQNATRLIRSTSWDEIDPGNPDVSRRFAERNHFYVFSHDSSRWYSQPSEGVYLLPK